MFRQFYVVPLVVAIACFNYVYANNGTLASTVLLTTDEIRDSQALDAADLLRQYAGIEISRIGGTAQEVQMYIRGNDAKHTTVLIDGIKINSGNTGLAALHNIKTDIIERVEIIKGPHSSLYGSGAIGGVINIITHRSQQNYKAYSYLGGDYDSQVRLDAHSGNNQKRMGITLSNFRAEGLPNLENSSVENAHYNNGAHLYYQTQWFNFGVEVSAWLQKGNTEYQELSTLIPRDQDFDNEFFSARFKRKVSSNWNHALSVSQILDHNHVHHKAVTATAFDFETSHRDELDWRHNIRLSKRQSLVMGANLNNEKNSAVINDLFYDGDITSSAVYMQDSIRLDNHQFVFAARYTNHEIFGNNVSWNSEYGYWFSDKTRLSAIAGTAYQAPTGIELFGINGNLDLEAETSQQWELGIHHNVDSTQSIGINLFGGETDNLIELDSGLSQFVNRGIHETQGIEASYSINRRQWGTRLAAVFQSPTDQVTGESLEKRAQRSMTAAAHYQVGRSRFAVELLAVDKRPDVTGGSVIHSGYGLVNLSAHRRMGKTWMFSGKIENLTDKEYQLVDGFTTTGQSIMIELTKTIDN